MSGFPTVLLPFRHVPVTEANRLAADILMPWHLLKDDEISGLSVTELAEKYQVSKAAMGIRLGVPA
jgi:Zn-dependent peptidase ImmA (M78 family)